MAKNKGTSTSDKIDGINDEITELKLSDNTNRNNIDSIREGVAKLEETVEALKSKVDTNKDEIIAGVKQEFVKYVEFEPVKTLVYGLVGGVLISVLFAVLALVIIPQVQSSTATPPGVSVSHESP